MAERFTDLLRRCRKRRRKIWLKRAGVAMALLLVAGGGLWYMQESARQPVTTAAVTTPRPEKPAVPAPARPVRPEMTTKVAPELKPAPKPAPEPVPVTMASEKAAGSVVKEELVGLKKQPLPRPKPAPVPAAPEKAALQKAAAAKPAPPEAPAAKPVQRAAPKPQRPILYEAKEAAEAPQNVKPVIEVKDVTDLDALVKQFEKYPRYATALKIAQIHFEKGEYEAASLWARKANLLDRDDEEAWIVYARSEYALGRRERAKRILRLYLDYKDSAKARTLLMGWSKE
ncbi:tetratricopeptide repeat protein [Hydrogenimonas sp.]